MDALFSKLAITLSLALQLAVLYVLIRKRLHRRFVWFLSCMVYIVVQAVLRLGAIGNQDLYHHVYWLTAIGEVGFNVLAVRESFLNVFRKYTRLRWFMWIVWSCIGVALLYAIFKAWIFPPVPATRRGVVIIDLQLAVDYTIAAIGLLYFGLTLFFKIKDHQWESGIIAGFTIYAVADLLPFVSRSVFGMRFKTAREWLPAIAYIVAEIGWAVVLSRPERKAQAPQRNLTVDDLSKLDHHIAVVARLLGRRP